MITSDSNTTTAKHVAATEGEVKMTKHEIIELIQRAGFEAVERDTVYNRAAL